jgi:hypothetical protein
MGKKKKMVELSGLLQFDKVEKEKRNHQTETFSNQIPQAATHPSSTH